MKKQAKERPFRYERKFVIEDVDHRKLESLIKIHPALFSEIHHERRVNNIYFDSHNFTNFRENIDGCSERLKVRVRWYGDLLGKIKKPKLELKIKRALLGTKKTFKLKNFILEAGFNIQTFRDVINQSELPDDIKELIRPLQPVLLNRYKRKYFLSADKTYRITIDKDLEYYSIKPHNNFFVSHFKDRDNTIIELKYASDKDNRANDISTLFPFRMTKSSKYVNGVDKFFGSTI